MSARYVVTGTDTGVGKTVFAAALASALGAHYWKPIQCGLEGGGDRDAVRRLAGLSEDRIVPERYRLRTPASPHRAAELDGIEIDVGRLAPPEGVAPLVIEGAGGLLVPITRKNLQIELFERWRIPVILCARTGLGTINHSLLSIEALGRRGVPILGIAFIGDENADTQRTIAACGRVRELGRLPYVAPLERAGLAAAFSANFSLRDFS
jgi:dethiobiotin synthetase